MKNLLKKAGLAFAMAATTLTAAAPAEAQWRRGYYRDRDNTGTAIVAGVAGLAIGAALASSADRRDRGYYDRRYYDRGYDDRGYRRGYNRHYRDRGYYPNRGYRGRDYRRCWTERQYDPYYGRPVRVRVCN